VQLFKNNSEGLLFINYKLMIVKQVMSRRV
jgi:hypothetical protein